MLRKTILTVLLATVLATCAPAQAQRARNAYDRMDSAKLAEVLMQMKMSELLDALVGQAGGGIEGKILQAKDKMNRALGTKDQMKRDKLLDEAMRIQAELIDLTKDAEDDKGQLRHYRFRLDRIITGGLTKVEPYVERLQYFLGKPGDAATVAELTGPAVRDLDRLLNKLMRVRDNWASDDEKMITGALWRMEEMIAEGRYRGAWIRFYSAMVMARGEDQRKMLLRQCTEDVAEYMGAADNSSGVKYSSLLLAGMASRELGDWLKCRALLNRADVKGAAVGDRMKAKFEIARSFIDQKNYAAADRQIDVFRTQSAKLPGVQAVDVDLQWTLLKFHRLMTEAAAVKAAAAAKARKLESDAFDLVMKLINRHPKHAPALTDLLLAAIGDRDASTLGPSIQLLQMRRLMNKPKAAGYKKAEEVGLKLLKHKDATATHKATVLWLLGIIYNEWRQNLQAGDTWCELAEKYPKDVNARKAAVNAVSSYQGPLKDPTKTKALLANTDFVKKYVRVLKVLVDTHGVKQAAHVYEIGMMLDILKLHADAIRYFEMVPDTSKLYMPARHHILLQRVQDLQEKGQMDWVQRRRLAIGLAGDLEAYIRKVKQFVADSKDAKLAAEVRKWGAQCRLLIARLHKDVTGNLAAAEKHAKQAIKDYKGVEGIEREANMLLMEILLEQNKVQAVIGQLTQLIKTDPTGAEKLLAMMVPKLGVRIEQLKFATTEEAKKTLKVLRPAYKLFADQLYKFAIQQGLKGEKLRPFKQAKAHAYEEGTRQEAQEALDLYLDLLQKRPMLGPYIRGKARCLRKVGKSYEAMEEYKKLLDGLPEKSPDWWRIQLESMRFFMELQRKKPTREGCKDIILQVRLLGMKDPAMGGYVKEFNKLSAEAGRLMPPEKKKKP